MANKTSIRKEGRVAENRFRQITGATKPARSEDGNAVVDGHCVAVAKVGKDTSTLNQVRAVKYLPLAAYHEPTGAWYVIPAHALVMAAAEKERGQHGEIAFECANFSIGHFAKYKIASEAQLKSAVLSAVAEGAKYPDLKKRMEQVVTEAAALGAKSRADVRTVIAALRIPGA